MSPRMNTPQPSQLTSRGFTIIELLIVIVIISILVGMLLAGINAVWPTVRAADTNVEISGFESGITQFTSEFGNEPPSFIRLYEAPAGWNGDIKSKTAISGLWNTFNFSLPRDLNGDGDATDIFTLSGDECLLFFLGGPDTITNVNDPADRPFPDGFARNPTNPFAAGGSRVGPFQEFDPARMIDYEPVIGGTADGVHSYVDAFPSTQVPYLYLSSYGGRGYRDSDRDMNGSGSVDTGPDSPELDSEYLQAADNPSTTGVNEEVSWKDKSYQIISAGIDGLFGTGGLWSSENGFANPSASAKDRDNVTNFSGGTLD